MSSPKHTKQEWLDTGYKHFALDGPQHLSINHLSKELGAPRASFYNYFGDLPFFVTKLLEMHWEIAKKFTHEGALHCRNLFPDVYELMEKSPLALNFSRQLFINRADPTFNMLFIKTYKLSADAFLVNLFQNHLSVPLNQDDAYDLWVLVGEAWYSRIDPHNLTALHMQQVAKEVLQTVFKLFRSDFFVKLNQE